MPVNQEERNAAPSQTTTQLISTAHCIFVPIQGSLAQELPPASNRIQLLEAILKMHDEHTAQVRANIIRFTEGECARIIADAAAEEAAEEKRLEAQLHPKQEPWLAGQWVWGEQRLAVTQDTASQNTTTQHSPSLDAAPVACQPASAGSHLIDAQCQVSGLSAELKLLVQKVEKTSPVSSPAPLSLSLSHPNDSFLSRRQDLTCRLLQCVSQALDDLAAHKERNGVRRKYYHDLLVCEMQEKAR
ncbi:hypothetical protein CDD82_313 [Ophiocordyceps australis]|uniref:Uncharacterized protein n=1 Tax=Ophiocordyceps australis TaxID=1399860 RepID=A0A2C5ZP68_9HYPO|nr:hypothetical protein CDD82_313 [Ophiocordyceps australis]